ncbi:arpA protein [Acidihalobacter aeolianus]|uniref:ArpA protein n=1 Tax=Acidihalobacter aeolianus TaxID=2792603 RepID=A0A1D8K7T1_9GAMM|nr:2OG-Fe(II) oxygenase [Acidihalobacter aeolianus]AOV17031.1 arpA protein [Acidihalobacter aeolianus]
MTQTITDLVDFSLYPLDDESFANDCAERLTANGVLTLPGFLRSSVVGTLAAEAEAQKHEAYYTSNTHNVYLTDLRPELGTDHIYNRQVQSSKGCITTDQVSDLSGLKTIYFSDEFRRCVAGIVGKAALYEYADPLSSINVHYASDGQELGWHFDNSEFAITLLLQSPESGGQFEYVRDLRDADHGELNFGGVAKVLDHETGVEQLDITPGTLVLFRGRNSMHRVTPVIGGKTRILVVLAYNSEPEIALSEPARMTFFGRLG